MTELLLATRNRHKTAEFAQLLGPDIQLRDLSHLAGAGEVAETGRTFEQNATIKARAVSALFPDALVLADDSGLEVEVLHGAPGIFSARYAGQNATDEQNLSKLLCELTRVGRAMEARRPRRGGSKTAGGGATSNKACFHCVLALARRGQVIRTFSGKVTGAIVDAPRGGNGFGYDPIFEPDGFNKTFAELAPETKNRISHRGRAATKLREFLAQIRTNDS